MINWKSKRYKVGTDIVVSIGANAFLKRHIPLSMSIQPNWGSIAIGEGIQVKFKISQEYLAVCWACCRLDLSKIYSAHFVANLPSNEVIWSVLFRRYAFNSRSVQKNATVVPWKQMLNFSLQESCLLLCGHFLLLSPCPPLHLVSLKEDFLSERRVAIIFRRVRGKTTASSHNHSHSERAASPTSQGVDAMLSKVLFSLFKWGEWGTTEYVM